MLPYDEFFRLYRACLPDPTNKQARDALIEALLPCVALWAKDVLADSAKRVKKNCKDDIIAAGSLKLFQRTLKLLDRNVDDGKHLVDSLRKSVRKAMKQALHRRFVVPFVTPDTIRDRTARGEPAYLPWEFRKQVGLESKSRQRHIVETNRVTPIDRRFFARDRVRPEAYRRFTHLICEAAFAWSRKWQWPSYLSYIYGFPTSVSEVAEWTGTPESTLRGRLRFLGREIVATAPFGVYEEGEVFLGKRWWSAAKSDPGWQRNNIGEFDDWVPWTQLPAFQSWLEASNGKRELPAVDIALAGHRYEGANGQSEFQEPEQPERGNHPRKAGPESGKTGKKTSKKLRFDAAENVPAGQRNTSRVLDTLFRRARMNSLAPIANPVLFAGRSIPKSTANT